MTITVQIDVTLHTDNPEEAYAIVCDELDKTAVNWESTDNWFWPDGSRIEHQQIYAARDAVHEERAGRVRILRDLSADNPRIRFDNAAVMWCKHSRYNLGDSEAESPEAYDEQEIACKLPLYLYDHSGITISTVPFSCPWDSGQVGWIYLTKARAEREGIKPEYYEKVLRAEVKIYDYYLQGEVWGYELGNGDSCWGFYGSTLEETGLLEELPERYHENLRKAWEERHG